MTNSSNPGVDGNAIAGAYSTPHAENQSSAAMAADPAAMSAEDKLIAAAEQAAQEAEELHPSDTLASRFVEMFAACRVMADEPLETTNYLFQWGGVELMPRQNIVSLKAPAKAGKTFALSAFTTAFLNGDFYGLRSNALPTDCVLFVDTEQARNDSRLVIRRILKNAPAAAERLIMLHVRNLPTADRLPFIEMAAEVCKPTMVVIDGIVDLIPGMDYNNNVMADEVTARMMALAEKHNAVVFTAIHTNKGNATEATGWLGRILQQKAVVELGLSRKAGGNMRTIEFISRGREVAPISVAIEETDDDLGQIRIVTPGEAAMALTEKEREKKREELLQMAADTHNEVPMVAIKGDFVKMVKEASNRADSAARKYVDRAIAAKALREAPDGFRYSLI